MAQDDELTCDYCGTRNESGTACRACGMNLKTYVPEDDHPLAPAKRKPVDLTGLVMPTWWKAVSWAVAAFVAAYLVDSAVLATRLLKARDDVDAVIRSAEEVGLSQLAIDLYRVEPAHVFSPLYFLVPFLVWRFVTPRLVESRLEQGEKRLRLPWATALLLVALFVDVMVWVGAAPTESVVDFFGKIDFAQLQESLRTLYAGVVLEAFIEVALCTVALLGVWRTARRLLRAPAA